MAEDSAARVSAPGYTIDESDYPLVVLRFSGETMSSSEWAQMFSRLEGLIAREESFGLLVDARRGLGASAAQRKVAGDFIRRNQEGLRRHCRGLVTVSSSAIVRGIITAVQWIAPPPFPERVEGDIVAARRWLEGQLGRRS